MDKYEWVVFFNVSQTELIERFAEHQIIISKSRMSLLFNDLVSFTPWQQSKLRTIENEVVEARRKAFLLYKNFTVSRNLKAKQNGAYKR